MFFYTEQYRNASETQFLIAMKYEYVWVWVWVLYHVSLLLNYFCMSVRHVVQACVNCFKCLLDATGQKCERNFPQCLVSYNESWWSWCNEICWQIQSAFWSLYLIPFAYKKYEWQIFVKSRYEMITRELQFPAVGTFNAILKQKFSAIGDILTNIL